MTGRLANSLKLERSSLAMSIYGYRATVSALHSASYTFRASKKFSMRRCVIASLLPRQPHICAQPSARNQSD